MPKKNTRQQILKAAIHCFAAAGYTGTTVDRIVQKARVNKRMVYHYFGSKEKLYQTVLEEVYSMLERLEVSQLDPSLPVETFFDQLLGMYFQFLENNQEFTRLLLWENLNRGRAIIDQPVALNKTPMLRLLQELLSRGKEEGKLREDLDARFLLIQIIGLCMVYFSNSYTLGKALELDMQAPRTHLKGLEQTLRMLLRGVLRA